MQVSPQKVQVLLLVVPHSVRPDRAASDLLARVLLLSNILHCMSGLKLYIEIHDDAEQDYGDDHRAADRIVQRDRDGAGRQENQDEGIHEKAEKGDQSGEAGLLFQAVRAMQPQSLFRFGGAQSGWRSFKQVEEVPQGHIPEAVQRLVRLPAAALSGVERLSLDHADRCASGRQWRAATAPDRSDVKAAMPHLRGR